MRGPALLAALALAGCGPTAKPVDSRSAVADTAAERMVLTASDGVKVFGTYTRAKHPEALILLFHQAGSSKEEYATIQPRLAAAGYSSLAIDQRAGGSMFGTNETVKALGQERSYLEAKRDLEAALSWATGRHLQVILWGSSYSASLALIVAAEHPKQVRTVLAFSPGEYFDGKPSVRAAAAKLAATAVFITSAQDPKEIAAARALFEALPAGFAQQQFVPTQGGAHGSSTLIATRNPAGAEAAWTAVRDYLDHSGPY